MKRAPKKSLLGITACTALESKCTYVRNKFSWLCCYMKQVHWDMVLRRKEQAQLARSMFNVIRNTPQKMSIWDNYGYQYAPVKQLYFITPYPIHKLLQKEMKTTYPIII